MSPKLAAGFAAAVSPVRAQAISTDARGLHAGEVRIPGRDGEIPAYHARPAGEGPFPVVLVVHEIFGVHEHIQDVCRRLARQGYLAVAPELFARLGDVSKIADIREILAQVVGRTPDAQIMSDLDAAFDWVVQSGKGDAARSAVTGFCWGGRITWLYCAHNARLKAGVAWYGRLEGAVTEMHPRYPVDVAGDMEVPVLGLYGGADQGIPLESIERMQAALHVARSKSEIIVFPGAPHAFFADYRPNYRADAAAEGWSRMLAWLEAHGVA